MKNITFVIILLLTICSCDTDKISTDYDTEALLTNIADNLVLVNYNLLKNDALELKINLDSLKQNPTIENLEAAQNQFVKTYKSYQKISVYNFGPAIDNGQSSLNIYPTNNNTINSNLTNGVYDLESGANLEAIGFPALDYLLFYDNNTNLIIKFSETNYSQYSLDVSNQISEKILAIHTDWTNSYKASFISNTGNQVGSSLSILANAFILNFERNGREAKIGIPAGVRSLNEAKPENVEALYGAQSITLAKEHITALKNIYEGNNGESFKSILISLKKEELANNISSQLDQILVSLNTLTEPFSDLLISNNQTALSTYNEYQKLLPMLKVDMTEALGLLISYSDSDGD